MLKVYRDDHKAERKIYKREYEKWRRDNDPVYAILCRLRISLNKTIRRVGVSKGKSVLELVGCSLDELKEHLEKQFTEGMTWENRGLWHIDHKRPCASFDLSDIAQQHECFHWSNLQPLWAKDNLIKGSRLALGVKNGTTDNIK